ncbi:PREDICTED: serologically defined colon cancer antigen 8 homolog isoform X1 [Polistes canadensis]|uniref:serologically defined colon cancer antigen 8 homolog isoform X1 n=1 Tax=Polistes canadensis TaxID=91411 RepID=UPI000718CD31|nr:PREDICTED: serologically defined colon cancer antigen 8 homolog isoform X1 [Polistes canadensis]
MLSSSNNRDRLIDISTTMSNSAGVSNTYLVRPRLPLRIYSKPKISGSYTHYPDSAGLSRTKRTKTRKTNGVQKIDLNKRKSPDYIEVIYREAVSKLKYLLAETYLPVDSSGKQQCVKSNYQSGRITKSGNDIDEQSFISEGSRMKDLNNDNVCLLPTPRPLSSKSIHPSKAYSNLALSIAELQSVPPEITSYIEQQEEYIEQMEQESQYCRSELTNLLSKVREVIAENEELHNKTKTGFLKYALDEHENRPENDCTSNDHSLACTSSIDSKMNKSLKILEGPNIIFESRISELEAQLTQAKLELRKVQEENQLNVKKLENSFSNGNVEISAQLNQTLRAKYDAEIKVEELQKALSAMRDREIESSQKAKRSMEMAQQMEFEKNQAETEVKRLKDELDRQHEKLREAAHEASRRITEERQQVERRYSQQVEQLSADITSQWNAANKSQLESEKQQRELLDLKRDLSQKQTIIDNLKKDLQNRISSLQSDLNQALTEKDMAEQEVIAAKLAAERNDRQTKQEQIRLQTEINAYKQRMERADADLVHCRRENLRLLEQIALLEKEINLNRMMYSEDSQRKDIIGQENKKETPTMRKLDMETKHVATVGDLEDALNKQAKLVSQLTTECQSLTQRLEANNVKHKEEMATLQSNIEYLSNKIKDSFHNQQALYNINASYNSPDQLNETKVNGNTNPHNSQNTDYDINQMQNENDNDNREIYSKKLQKKDDLDERYDHSNQREYTLGGYINNNNNNSNIYNIEDQSIEEKNGEQEKHLTDDQNIIDNTNLMESSYDQYGEYDESQYQEQEFKDNDQYKEQDNTHDMTQYSEQEYQENHSAINPSNEYTQ